MIILNPFFIRLLFKIWPLHTEDIFVNELKA
jgi:hypothetical protein